MREVVVTSKVGSESVGSTNSSEQGAMTVRGRDEASAEVRVTWKTKRDILFSFFVGC